LLPRPSGFKCLFARFPWSGGGCPFFCPSALRSFRVSPALFTTTASADFSPPLGGETSPGKVHELSARAARLYSARLSVIVGFRVSWHAYRPRPASLPCSCSYGRAFAMDFFHPADLAVVGLSFTTVVFTVSGHLFSYDEFMPMPGTPGTALRSGPKHMNCPCAAPFGVRTARPGLRSLPALRSLGEAGGEEGRSIPAT